MATNTRTADAIKLLTEGVEHLGTTGAWEQYLRAARTFHTYSFNNVLLLTLQNPRATRVAGFHAWRKLGRSVSRGEKALWVLAPITRRRSDGADEQDGTDAERTTSPRQPVGFRAVPVWDVSQTEGEPLPELATRLLGDDPLDAYAALTSVAQSLGYRVEDADLPGARNGDCTFDLRRIRVHVDNSPAQRTKTLAHEIAHAMLHEGCSDRARAELEAESVAFVVCAELELDSSAYSFGYVTTWAGGTDEAIAGIKASGARIQSTVHSILSSLGGGAGPGAGAGATVSPNPDHEAA
ncbi:MAG TPA: ArdC-like ssDNA-binding domain-containing protein [Acidimicrobiales bacterium]|nr:ArdC-like ssDNA-binding domain-containing protein [Acidimicrobiales bacterium]